MVFHSSSSDVINAKVSEVEALWAKLKDLSAVKGQTLQAEFDRFDNECKQFAEVASAFASFMEEQRKDLDALEGNIYRYISHLPSST